MRVLNCLAAAAAAAGLLAALAPVAANAAVPECASILPAPGVDAAAVRDVTPEDLAEVRDIVSYGAYTMLPPAFEISPDGRIAAFKLQRADLARNSYCVALVTVELGVKSAARVLHESDAFVPQTSSEYWAPDKHGGRVLVQSPRWSPDGRWIAFITRSDGLNRIRVAARDGGEVLQVPPTTTNIESVAWSADGKALIWSTPLGADLASQQLKTEGLTGFHFDGRFHRVASQTPVPARKLVTVAFDIGASATRPATPGEASLLAGVPPEGIPKSAALWSITRSGPRAWVEDLNPYRGSARGLRLAAGGKSPRACEQPECKGALFGVWQFAKDDGVYFMRRDGWGRGATTMYRWSPDAHSVKRLWSTRDVLVDCQMAAADLVCGFEASDTPHSLVRVSVASGDRRMLFDPNPELAHLRQAQVQRLEWRNGRGAEAYGVLVLPSDHRPGQKHPLIVNRYEALGFLRAGGNEVPVQALASRGFAVLLIHETERLFPFGGDPKVVTDQEAQRLFYKDDAAMKDAMDSLLGGVDAAIALGVIDDDRMGLTGFSFGSSTVQWVLDHTDRFKAASVSHCCDDVLNMMTIAGLKTSQQHLAWDFPLSVTLGTPEGARLARISQPRIPFLIQASEWESKFAFRTFIAMRQLGRPIDMFIFPDEDHVKWQPAHRLAIFKRNIDWFEFWLNGTSSDDPARAEELKLWGSWKAAAQPGKAGT